MADSLYDHLAALMDRYHTTSLVGVSPEAFRAKIERFVNNEVAVEEGWDDPMRQRDFSVNFVWGHHHDFGTFKQKGRMADRHIRILARFISELGMPIDLTGASVLDVGVWTGGTSLMFHAMGAEEVVGVEEVAKYATAFAYLCESFGLDSVKAVRASLYDLTYFQEFEHVICSGVLYHVSDPIVALRILYNALRPGGTLWIETETYPSEQSICVYSGPTQIKGVYPHRKGWNWFIPSLPALERMLRDIGFSTVELGTTDGRRLVAKAIKGEHIDMLRAGLSRRLP